MLELARQSLGNVGRNVAAASTFADLGGKPRLRPFLGTLTSLQVAGLGHPMSRDALVRSRHTPVSPRNLKRRRMSAAAAPASGKDAR